MKNYKRVGVFYFLKYAQKLRQRTDQFCNLYFVINWLLQKVSERIRSQINHKLKLSVETFYSLFITLGTWRRFNALCTVLADCMGGQIARNNN